MPQFRQGHVLLRHDNLILMHISFAVNLPVSYVYYSLSDSLYNQLFVDDFRGVQANHPFSTSIHPLLYL